MNLIEHERAKYTEIWDSVPDYRNYSPGEENVQRFMSILRPDVGQSLLDIGCGTGKAGLKFQSHHNLVVDWLDITDAALLPDIPRGRFINEALWQDWHNRIRMYGYDYGFCCDVMEHIPTEYTMLVLHHIIRACYTTWFQIALVPDAFGASIGQPLHLTVKPFVWWLERLRGLGYIVDARDLCGQALFVVSR